MLHSVKGAGLLLVICGLCSSARLLSKGREPTFMRVPIVAGLTIGVLAEAVHVIVVLGTVRLLPPRILGIFVIVIGLEITILVFRLLVLLRSCMTEL